MSTNTNHSAPLYVTFARGIVASCQQQGLPLPDAAPTPSGLPENEGYLFVRWGGLNSAALIVPKSKLRMGNLHSHLDLSAFPGCLPLPRKNGRVVCHFEPDLSKVANALAAFVGASKRPVAAPVRTTPGILIGASQTSSRVDTRGDAEVASWSESPARLYDDSEAEEALRAILSA